MREWKGTKTMTDRVRMGAPGNGRGAEGEAEGGVMVAPARTRPKRPPMYKVILLNDDYTPMEFVVQVLMEIFHKPQSEAVELMLTVHQQGAAVAGIYTREVAETKSEEVVEAARIPEYPLQCALEPNE